MTLIRFGFLLPVFLLIQSQLARAAGIHETFIVEGSPNAEQIEQWSKLPGKRGFNFILGDAYASELELIAKLKGWDRLQIQVSRYPGDDVLKQMQVLAALGAELVTNVTSYPTPHEITQLNKTGFKKIILVLNAFPGENDGAQIGRLTGDVSITFAHPYYPRYLDIEAFKALPAHIPFMTVTQFWPSYVQMDILNLIPQRKKLRVSGVFPSEENFKWLHRIKMLDEVTVDAAFAPPAGIWEKFGAIPVRWTMSGWVPQAKELTDFENSGQHRRLIIDQDYDLTQEERSRLGKSGLAVEWIHAVN